MTTTVHKFEERGLGKAPFECISYGDAGSIKLGKNCQYCGTAIRHIYTICSSDGRKFIVGCECVNKTGDRGLIKFVEATEKARREDVRRIKREKEAEAFREHHEAVLQAQRAKNDGKTDAEVETERTHAIYQKNRDESVWLSSALRRQGGNFALSVANELEGGSRRVADLSDRCIWICLDIFARLSGGRAGSKAYEAAAAEFWAKVRADA